MAEAPAEGAPEGLGLAKAWRSLTAHIKLPDIKLPDLSLREPDAWQILYDLRTEEAAVRDRPSPMEVRAMLLAYEQAAAKLVRLGEPEKAQDVLHVLMPAFRERTEVVAAVHAEQQQSHSPQPSFPPPPAHAPLASRVRVVVSLPDGAIGGAARVSLLGVAPG